MIGHTKVVSWFLLRLLCVFAVRGKQPPREKETVERNQRNEDKAERCDLEKADALAAHVAQQAVHDEIVPRPDEREVGSRERATIEMTAVLLNPASASSVLTCHEITSSASTTIATTSARIQSVASRTTAAKRMLVVTMTS